MRHDAGNTIIEQANADQKAILRARKRKPSVKGEGETLDNGSRVDRSSRSGGGD